MTKIVRNMTWIRTLLLLCLFGILNGLPNGQYALADNLEQRLPLHEVKDIEPQTKLFLQDLTDVPTLGEIRERNTMFNSRSLFWIGGIVGVIVVVVALAISTIKYGTLPVGSWATVGSTAPDFELTTLSGETIRLEQMHGQPIVMSFGTTWCVYCRREARLLQDLHEQYPDLAVIFIDIEEDAKTVQQFADEFGLTFPVALDLDGSVSREYGVFRFPSLFFIDKEAVVQAHLNREIPQEQLITHLKTIGVAIP
jgi:cytochrome c biogenesis protein CcmG, thiol:disulfide interchange protein DsbE